MIQRKIFILLFLFIPLFLSGQNTVPEQIGHFLKQTGMEGSTLTCVVREVANGKTVCRYQDQLQVTPASVMKLVTTATALEILGSDYRYPTTLAYDGTLNNGVLQGNLYIIGSGDPTLGSSHFAPESKNFLETWIKALQETGIRQINGAVVADESVFDTEGISPKWVYEDLGSYYGAGSYGLSVFDNLYRLSLRTTSGKRPQIIGTEPAGVVRKFHNYLVSSNVRTDSCYILGAPFADERYLYGVIPAGKERYTLKGDIPDPALFLAQYVTDALKRQNIPVAKPATCYRILQENGKWKKGERKTIVTTYSPTLRQIVEKTNHVSHNLYADALLKTIGLQYQTKPGEVLSSFGKGIRLLKEHWDKAGLDITALSLYDGSGLSPTDKVTADFMADLLCYMATQSPEKQAFLHSLPEAGKEGSVRNFLKGSSLQGQAWLKSGSMSRVKGYAGYIEKDGKRYAIALFLNQYNTDGGPATRALARLIESLF